MAALIQLDRAGPRAVKGMVCFPSLWKHTLVKQFRGRRSLVHTVIWLCCCWPVVTVGIMEQTHVEGGLSTSWQLGGEHEARECVKVPITISDSQLQMSCLLQGSPPTGSIIPE